jgi:hypothetical protein
MAEWGRAVSQMNEWVDVGVCQLLGLEKKKPQSRHKEVAVH